MGGRLSAASISEFFGWRWAMGVIGAFSLVCAIAFAFALPRERHTTPKAELIGMAAAIRMHLGDPGLQLIYALGFLLMGAFVTTYNYIGFHLAQPPFALSQTAIGFVFIIYLLGAIASAVAGDLAGRFGRRQVILPAVALMPIGVLATLTSSLWLTVLGVALITVAFFGGHSIASSWVGLRVQTGHAQASALYLFFYYLGSSVAGSSGGWALAAGGWPGVAGFVGALACLAFFVALKLSHVAPPAHLLTLAPEPEPERAHLPPSG
jgi:YNFM family putative membrane transporter